MKWEIYDSQDKLIDTAYDISEAHMMCEDYGDGTYLRKIVTCRGCDDEGQEQHDAYGISTGHWCGTCYDSPKYPYRKERYDYEAYGERLDDNY